MPCLDGSISCLVWHRKTACSAATFPREFWAHRSYRVYGVDTPLLVRKYLLSGLLRTLDKLVANRKSCTLYPSCSPFNSKARVLIDESRHTWPHLLTWSGLNNEA